MQGFLATEGVKVKPFKKLIAGNDEITRGVVFVFDVCRGHGSKDDR